MKKVIKAMIISIVFLIAAFFAMCYFIIYEPGLLKYYQEAKLDKIKAQLENERPEIEKIQKELKDFSKDINDYENRLKSLKKFIDNVEMRYPNGIPSGDLYNNYREAIDNYNSVAKRYNDLSFLYSKHINTINNYNNKITEANELARRTGNRWYVAPIPVGK